MTRHIDYHVHVDNHSLCHLSIHSEFVIGPPIYVLVNVVQNKEKRESNGEQSPESAPGGFGSVGGRNFWESVELLDWSYSIEPVE